MICNIVSTGSHGNAVIYHKSILVDIGVSFEKLRAYYRSIDLVLLTHIHKDHFKSNTIKKLINEKPTIRFGCCEWLVEELEKLGARHIDVYKIGEIYDYGDFMISPIYLYHDVPNCGYRIYKGSHKAIHATDTYTLDGIVAKGYDLYAIEHNYDEETVQDRIFAKQSNGEYAYEIRSIKSHLSYQQAQAFYQKNRKDSSEIIMLHISKINGRKIDVK